MITAYLVNPIRSILARREFIWHLNANDLRSLYRDTVLGFAWAILRPLVQVSAYIFILTTVFRANPKEFNSSWEYVGYICVGLSIWQFVQRSLEEATSLVRSRQEIIRQMIFPIETLPCVNLLSCAIGPTLTFAIGVIIELASGAISFFSILAFPTFVVLLLMCVIGSSWIFMILGVFVRDIREIIAVLFGLLVYVSPVILTRSMVNEKIWMVIMLNPLSHIVIALRDALGGTFHFVSWCVFSGWAIASWIVGAICVRYAQNRINEYA